MPQESIELPSKEAQVNIQITITTAGGTKSGDPGGPDDKTGTKDGLGPRPR